MGKNYREACKKITNDIWYRWKNGDDRSEQQITLDIIDKNIMINNAKIQDIQEKLEKLREKPFNRELSQVGLIAELLVPFVGSATAAVAIATNYNLNSEDFLALFLSSGIVGFGAGMANAVAYIDRPVSTYICGKRIISNVKKMNELKHENDKLLESRDIYATYGMGDRSDSAKAISLDEYSNEI